MTFSVRYSFFYLLFFQYVEAIGLNFCCAIFGIFFPSTFARQLYPSFSKSDVIEHPVLHMMIRMFCIVLILLGMIQFSLIRYCTSSSNTNENRLTKKYILKVLIWCFAIADIIHVIVCLNYYMTYGSLLELSTIGNLYGTIGLFVARMIFLRLNYQNENNNRKEK